MLNRQSSGARTTLLIAIFGLVPLVASAQKVEIFGGYQFTHLQPAFNANGWNGNHRRFQRRLQRTC
jgi:hypothetical protein